MADGADRRAGAGGKPAKKAGGRRKLTDAEKRRRAEARRVARQEAAERERREALSPLELVEEDAQAAKGAARTVVSGQLYQTIFREWAEGMSHVDLAERH